MEVLLSGQAGWVCPKCGHLLTPNMTLCPFCGLQYDLKVKPEYEDLEINHNKDLKLIENKKNLKPLNS